MTEAHEIRIEQGLQHVRIEIDGVIVADTRRPLLLFEGRLPVRYYIPREDLRLPLLQPTTSHSRCPWKGDASYLSARIGEHEHADIAWYYDDPLPGVAAIADHVAFYNDRVEISVDGVALDPVASTASP